MYIYLFTADLELQNLTEKLFNDQWLLCIQ